MNAALSWWIVWAGALCLWGGAASDPAAPLPLAVGTVWDYEADAGRSLRRVVESDTLVGGTRYAVVVDTTWGAGGAVDAVGRSVIRLDAATGQALEWDGTADHPARSFLPCPLALEAEVVCAGGEVRRLTVGERPLPIAGGARVRTRTYAAEEGFGVLVLAEGVGPVLVADADRTLTLRHARVGGRHYGTPPRPVPTAPGPAVRVWPNPSRGATTLEFEAPNDGPFVAEVYDALGRRVRRVPLPTGAGPHRVRLGADGGLAAGTYVVRVVGGGDVVGAVPFVRL